MSLPSRMDSLSLEDEKFKKFGRGLRSDFQYDPSWTNLNHGSFGGIPNIVKSTQRAYQDKILSRPDIFLRYDYAEVTREARAAVAEILHAPVETVVLVSNATEAVNTVFRNLAWAEDGREDVVLHFSTIFESCRKTIEYVVDYFGPERVSSVEMQLKYPMEDEEILTLFRETVQDIKKSGKRPRICVYDVVSSLPGVCFPWKEMTSLCRKLGVLSFIDGAQSIGMVPLDLAAVDPDFFTSNCHKWLFTPHGCAVFQVPLRNHHLLPTTLATTVTYLSLKERRSLTSSSPPDHTPSREDFAQRFESTGTKDYTPWYCLKDAIAYRRDDLGGEETIMAYLRHLNKQGSQHVAQILNTKVLDNQSGSLTDCAMANVALPIWIHEKGDDGNEEANENDIVVPLEEKARALAWMQRACYQDYDTFMPVFCLNGRFWARISAQVYLDMRDYQFAAETIQKICKRIANKEYLKA